MAELAKTGAEPLQLARAGTRLVEHAPPAPPRVIDYPNERAALHVFRRRVVELIHDGWDLRVPDADIASARAADPTVEAALASDLDPAQLAVYTDWLIERGDPCGELAALRARDDRAVAPAIARLENERGYDLYGLLADVLADVPRYRTTVAPLWRLGWIEGLALDQLHVGPLVALALLAPMARFVRRLVVKHNIHIDAVHYALARSPRAPAIRRLEVVHAHDAGVLLSVLPALDEVVLPGGAHVTGHPHIRRAEVVIDFPRPHFLTGSWPALESLTIRSSIPAAALGAMLLELPAQSYARQLTELHIDGAVDADSLTKLATLLPRFRQT